MTNLTYHERTIATVLQSVAKTFSAMILTGPRQSGKTTLLRHLFGATHRYLSLEDAKIRKEAEEDPILLLQRFPPPRIVDEIQYVPSLLHAIKIDIDEHRQDRGRYLITGSQHYPLMQGVTESLAGRAAIMRLLSFSLGEASQRSAEDITLDDVLAGRNRGGGGGAWTYPSIMEHIWRGGFPEVVTRIGPHVETWHAACVQTYLERDVRSLRAVGDLLDFERFLALLAARSANLLNFTELGREIGVTDKTVRSWLSVLETGRQVQVLKGYFMNLGKRVRRAPKVYFLDTGTLCHLLALREPAQVGHGVAAGVVFETAVFCQLIRLFEHRGKVPRIYFWRTAAGHEVDFIIDLGQTLIPVEAKLTATPKPAHAGPIRKFRELFGDKVGKGLVVCLCEERFPLAEGCDAVPLWQLG